MDQEDTKSSDSIHHIDSNSDCEEFSATGTSGSSHVQDSLGQDGGSGDSLGHLSKRQLRKMRKHQTWLQRLPEKRAKEKMKKKQRRQEALARGESLGPTRKMLKLNSMEKSSCRVKVVLDCSFDEYMNDRDIMKLTKQVGFCYSANRRAENPVQFYVCGLHGQMKNRLESVGDYTHWDVNFTEKDYHEVFDKEKIVYLSADSPNILEKLSDDQVYIIGGLVDHNQYRGLCHEMAVEKGMQHAQLPIGQYIEMKSRRILTVNHVFEILLKYTEKKNWKDSFFTVIPQRKVAGGKDTEEEFHQQATCTGSQNEKINSNEKITLTDEKQSSDGDNSRGNVLVPGTTTSNEGVPSCSSIEGEHKSFSCDKNEENKTGCNELPTDMLDNCAIGCTGNS